MDIGGHRCGPPLESLATASTIGKTVKRVCPGVVLSSSFLGVNESGGCQRLHRVNTLFGGNMWVIGPLTTSEVLSCWDVPEKIGVLSGIDERRTAI
jgi:hypothetical protein